MQNWQKTGDFDVSFLTRQDQLNSMPLISTPSLNYNNMKK